MESTSRVDAGLSHPYARPTLLFGWIMVLAAALINGALPPIGRWDLAEWSVVLTVVIVFAVATRRSRGALPAPLVILVVGVSLVSAAVVVWTAGESTAVPYAFGYLNLGVCLLILRGHTLVGTVSSGLLIAGILVWGAQNGADGVGRAEQLAPLLVALTASHALLRIMRSIAGGRSRVVAQRLRTVAETDAARIRHAGEHRALSEIPPLVDGLLRRISAGEALTDEFRAQLLTADEAVRDHLRRDLPYHAGFLRAVSETRTRGAAVRLLGSETRSAGMSEALADRLIALLTAEDLTSATIRFSSHSRGGATSMLLDGGAGIRRHDFDPAGNLLREPS